MAHVSHFSITPERFAPWIAALWQGPAPAGVHVHCYVHLDPGDDGSHRMLVVWDCDDPAGLAPMEQAFSQFGTFVTEPGRIATAGLAAAFERDLDAFRSVLSSRDAPEAAIERELDLRRRGFRAETQADAITAGEAWALEAPPSR